MLGRAVQGLALVTSGAVAEGMRALDEVNAAVVAGEMKDLVAIGLSCCYMIAACDRVRDYDRAMQWCTRLKAFCAQWGLRPLFAVCRTQYASICMWRGTWLEAEQELTAATDELAASRPAMTADGLVRLAELRRRQGRLVEAAGDVRAIGAAQPGVARTRGAGVRPRRPAGGRRARRALPASRDAAQPNGSRRRSRAARARARAARAISTARSTALAELTNIATLVETLPLQGARRASRPDGSRLAVGDPNAAQRHFEDAVDRILQSGAPFELSRARIELARTLAARGRVDAAREEAQRAMDLLGELKAELEMVRAKTLLDSLRSQAAAHGRLAA